MPIFATAGSRIYIGAALAAKSVDFVQSDFTSQTWTEIQPLESIGSLGDTSQEVSMDVIGLGRTQTLKGTRKAEAMQLVAGIDYTDPGQIALLAAERTPDDYAFKLVFNDKPAAKSATVTMTIAAPGVISWAAHGLVAGNAVKFSTTGALPTGLTAGTTYYVLAAGFTTDSFQVSATPGGSAITTTGTQSGVHTATSVPSGSQRFFVGKVMSATEALDGANNVMKLNANLAVNSNVVRVAAGMS